MIETERLLLRDWRDADRPPFREMSRDPRVMATLGPVMTAEQSDALIDRVIARRQIDGHTFWAMIRRSDDAFLGWCGLVRAGAELPIAGELEVGWRLSADHWGHGYAREGALASLGWAWAHTGADRVVAITAEVNERSRHVMERIGMSRVSDGDFDHPNVAVDSVLRPHVLYAIDRPQ